MAGFGNGLPQYHGDLEEYGLLPSDFSEGDEESGEGESLQPRAKPRDPGTRGGRSHGSFNKSWTQWTTVDGWADAQDALRTKMIEQAAGGEPLSGGYSIRA